MRSQGMRWWMKVSTTYALALGLLGGLSGCATPPPPTLPALAGANASPATTHASAAAWPTHFRRSFFATLTFAGKRSTVLGVLDVHNPADFRLTVATELGQTLFDARQNWAGCKIFRCNPNIPAAMVEIICRDVELALREPPEATPAQAGSKEIVVRLTDHENHRVTYTFSAPDGNVKSVDIDLGLFDTLHLQYGGYAAGKAPAVISLHRPARAYTLMMTFTDTL